MKVSVIVPVYNVEKFILRCLESIINQTMTEEVECIIVNDCTPDESMQIINRRLTTYDGNIHFKIINHKRNRGVAVVRNTGLENACGDYFIYIDSDDYCESDMLEKMYQKAVEEDADVIIADYYVNNGDKEYYCYGQMPNGETDYVKRIICGQVMHAFWTKMIKLSFVIDNALKNVEGIDLSEDYYFLFRVFLLTNKITYIPCAFYHYTRYNVNSYTYKIYASEKFLTNCIELDKRITKLYEEYNLFDKYSKEYSLRNLSFRKDLMLRTTGNLQKKYNSLYNRTFPLPLLFCRKGLSFHWKIGLLFASWNMLFVYNIVRYLWTKVKGITIEYIA